MRDNAEDIFFFSTKGSHPECMMNSTANKKVVNHPYIKNKQFQDAIHKREHPNDLKQIRKCSTLLSQYHWTYPRITKNRKTVVPSSGMNTIKVLCNAG